jgi:hypothetical protein
MKIVLSRKGFDSANGGVPSPIFPDGSLFSLPIPASSSPTRFADCRWRGQGVGTLVESLTAGRVAATSPAHLDPDLDVGALARAADWRPAFGQTGAAQSHLAQHGIDAGDLFLFFGWFREVQETVGGTWRFKRNAPDLHVLFGWLAVGEVLRIGNRVGNYGQRCPWLRNHPHLHGTWSEANTIYVAAENMRIPGRQHSSRRAGAGIFPVVSESRTLTAPGQPLRSSWRLPGWFHPADGDLALSYHGRTDRWSRPPDGSTRLNIVARGQEFVLTTDRSRDVADWLSEIFS